jgi:FdhE protein
MPAASPEAAAWRRVMPARVSSGSRWDQRIARAQTLADEHPAAREALAFYAAVASYQKSLAHGAEAGDALPLEAVLDAVPDFLTWLSHHAPAPLAASATEMRSIERDEWERLGSDLVFCTDVLFPGKRTSVQEIRPDFEDRLQKTRSDPGAVFVVEALLQPSAELAMDGRPTPASSGESAFPARCPACRALPVLAMLREEGQGAKRTLLCSLCFTEWAYRRILCPHCGERQFDELPVYTAQQFEHVRIAACSRCQRYIKTIDLTQNGLAVPPADDIASVALDLWARAQGYVRIKANLLAL